VDSRTLLLLTFIVALKCSWVLTLTHDLNALAIHSDITNPPRSCLPSRKPLWQDLVSLDIRSQWKENWRPARVVNFSAVDDSTIRQPDLHLPRQQVMESDSHWFVKQTMSHIVNSYPLTKLNGGLSQLHSADDEAAAWLTNYGSWCVHKKKKNALAKFIVWICFMSLTYWSHLSHIVLNHLYLGIIRKYVLAFSIRANGSRILSVDNPPTDGSTLPALHGIRFISMTWVILGHTYVIGLFLLSKLMFISILLSFEARYFCSADILVTRCLFAMVINAESGAYDGRVGFVACLKSLS